MKKFLQFFLIFSFTFIIINNASANATADARCLELCRGNTVLVNRCIAEIHKAENNTQETKPYTSAVVNGYLYSFGQCGCDCGGFGKPYDVMPLTY